MLLQRQSCIGDAARSRTHCWWASKHVFSPPLTATLAAAHRTRARRAMTVAARVRALCVCLCVCVCVRGGGGHGRVWGRARGCAHSHIAPLCAPTPSLRAPVCCRPQANNGKTSVLFVCLGACGCGGVAGAGRCVAAAVPTHACSQTRACTHPPAHMAHTHPPAHAGNICRSPTAEATFRAAVQEAGLADAFDIDSCGTGVCVCGGCWHLAEPCPCSSSNSAPCRL
jgi:hypothetical protein